MRPLLVLVADDQAGHRRFVARLLREVFGQRMVLLLADDGAEAIARIRSFPVDLVVTDFNMPGASGLEVARAARLRRPATQVIIVTGDPTDEQLRNAVGGEILACLAKPLDLERFVTALRNAEARVPVETEGCSPHASGRHGGAQ